MTDEQQDRVTEAMAEALQRQLGTTNKRERRHQRPDAPELGADGSRTAEGSARTTA